MSYILEALKKSEQERNIGNVPGLATSHRTAAVRKKRGRWFWPLAALLAFNALLVYALFNYNPQPPAQSVATAPAPVSPKTETATAEIPAPAAQAPVVQPKPVPKPAQPRSVMTKPVKSAPVKPRPVKQVVRQPARKAPPRPAAQSKPPAKLVAAPKPANPASPPSHVYRDPKDRMVGKDKAGSSAATGEKTDSDLVPAFRDLPEKERAGIPVVKLDVHVYDRDPKLRFVLINLEKYREGDVLKEGPELQKIVPNGVVLSYHNKRYRLDRP